MKKIYSMILLLVVFIISATSCRSEVSSTITAESEPITITECSEIYYENQEHFEAIKDYLLSLPGYVYIGLENQEFISEYKIMDQEIDQEIEKHLSALKESGVKSITKELYNNSDTPYTRVDFYIDGTSSSRYGVSWHNSNQKFATSEIELSDNWYSYFIGYT